MTNEKQPRESFVRCLTYNILDGGRGREQELTEIIAAQNADVILLQEVMDAEFIARLAARLKTEYCIADSNSPRHVALLSRLPMCAASSFRPDVLRHGMLEVTLEYALGKTLTIFGVHLSAPAYTFLVEMYRLRELEVILRRIAATPRERMILAGDFNSIAPRDRPDFNHLPFSVRMAIFLQGGSMAHQVIGKIRANGWSDVFRTLHPHDSGYTLPASQPNTRLDYFFVNAALRQNLRACDVVRMPSAVKRASDHLPVILELEL